VTTPSSQLSILFRHRVYAWRNLSKFGQDAPKGAALEGTLHCREVEDEIKGTTFKRRIAKIHATTMKRLSKIEAADDPSDGAGDDGYRSIAQSSSGPSPSQCGGVCFCQSRNLCGPGELRTGRCLPGDHRIVHFAERPVHFCDDAMVARASFSPHAEDDVRFGTAKIFILVMRMGSRHPIYNPSSYV
jgi:hypothetical protein